MTLRAACRLAENADAVLERAVAALCEAGIDTAIVASSDKIADGEVDLLFACGLRTIVGIHEGNGRRVIAAPHFPDEVEPAYRSVVIAARPMSLPEAAVRLLAVNEYTSWSGWHGYVDFLRRRGIPPNNDHVVTESHRSSAEAVREGRAEVASIDATVWRELVDPRGLHIIATTHDWPTPPISISATIDAETGEAIADVLHRHDNISAATTLDYEFMIDAAR